MDASDVTAREVIIFPPIFEKVLNFIGIECNFCMLSYIWVHMLSVRRAWLSRAFGLVRGLCPLSIGYR